MRITSYSSSEFSFDPDTPEGKDGIKEAFGKYELDAKTWFPFARQTYNLSSNLEDCILVVTPICPSDLPNRNGIAFPLEELTKFQPPPVARMVYKAWTGCPMHIEHDNTDCTKAIGAILDTTLNRINGYGNNEFWKVMGLLAVDKYKNPEIAQKILTRELNTYSMGAECTTFTCSFCNQEVNDQHTCHHVKPGNVNFNVFEDPVTRKPTLAFINAHDLSPIEISVVGEPAWVPALSDEFLRT